GSGRPRRPRRGSSRGDRVPGLGCRLLYHRCRSARHRRALNIQRSILVGDAYWLPPIASPHDGGNGRSEVLMPPARKARAIGLNHVALEVGDIDEALAFYGRLFEVKLRGRSKTMAFIDLGDQFIALPQGRAQAADDGRHFGLVVDDKDAI